MYLYETHMHTSPVSKCARATVRESLEFYKSLGYDGVFITNHFLDGNINIDYSLPYEEKINFYFSDYEQALKLSEEIGIKVFLGIEMSNKGTDFLVYGLDKAWFLAHPEIMQMKKSELLTLLASAGALIIQAHPFREKAYIDHIRLFPRHVHGVEVFNACQDNFVNKMAKDYAKNYSLIPFAGSDNHIGAEKKVLGGMKSKTPVKDEADFVEKVKAGLLSTFSKSFE